MAKFHCMYLIPKDVYNKLLDSNDDSTRDALTSGAVRQLNNLNVRDGGRVVIRNDDHYKNAEGDSITTTTPSKPYSQEELADRAARREAYQATHNQNSREKSPLSGDNRQELTALPANISVFRPDGATAPIVSSSERSEPNPDAMNTTYASQAEDSFRTPRLRTSSVQFDPPGTPKDAISQFDPMSETRDQAVQFSAPSMNKAVQFGPSSQFANTQTPLPV